MEKLKSFDDLCLDDLPQFISPKAEKVVNKTNNNNDKNKVSAKKDRRKDVIKKCVNDNDIVSEVSREVVATSPSTNMSSCVKKENVKVKKETNKEGGNKNNFQHKKKFIPNPNNEYCLRHSYLDLKKSKDGLSWEFFLGKQKIHLSNNFPILKCRTGVSSFRLILNEKTLQRASITMIGEDIVIIPSNDTSVSFLDVAPDYGGTSEIVSCDPTDQEGLFKIFAKYTQRFSSGIRKGFLVVHSGDLDCSFKKYCSEQKSIENCDRELAVKVSRNGKSTIILSNIIKR